MSQSGQGIDVFGGRNHRPRYRLIACEVMYRECCYAAAVSRNVVDLHFTSQGWHDLKSATMCERVQAEVDAAPKDRYAALLLGFGLCNNGIVGLRARDLPLIIPRAHDCITFFMGSREAYQRHFDANGGAYYLTTGWIERDKENIENTMGDENNMLRQMGLNRSYEEMVAQYGEENAKMIFATIGGLHNYRQFTHIDMGVAPEVEAEVGRAGREEAGRRGWTFEIIAGRLDLLRALTDGPWPTDRFLTLEPGQTVQPAYDGRIIQAGE
ncbi:MAG: DUF1638 domain-containing protein [bacterium]|nr:DUF1638 domain-containing protein [bacterium]